MNWDAAHTYLLQKPHTTRELPFGPGALVFKIGGKMFAMLPEEVRPDEIPALTLKVEPMLGQILRENYAAVTGAYHMNKSHWIDVRLDATVPADEIANLIDNSYRLVVNGLKQAVRKELGLVKS